MSFAKRTAEVAVTVDSLPPSYDSVSLPAIRKRLRQMPDIFDFGVTPSSPDYRDAIMSAHDQGVQSLFFPVDRTNYACSSTLLFDRGIHLVAEGTSQAIAINGPSATGIWFRGQESSGGGIEKLSVTWTSTARTITGISKSNPAVVTYTGASLVGYSAIVIRNVSGMTEVNQRRFNISNITTNSFTLTGENSTGYNTYLGDGNIYIVKGTAVLCGNGSETATTKPDNLRFFGLNITATQGCWDYGLYLDGRNYNGATKSLGIRNGRIYDLTTTQTVSRASVFNQARGWDVVGYKCDTGLGLNNTLLLDGPGIPASDGSGVIMKSRDVTISGFRGGGVDFGHAGECTSTGLVSYGPVYCSPNAVNIFMSGFAQSFGNDGTNCRFARGEETPF